MLHREKPSWGVHSICSPWPRNSNLVTVEQGTFHHSSTLPAISMDFSKDKKNKAIDTISQIVQPMTSQRGEATGHRPASRHRPSPIHRQPFPRTMFINSCQSGHPLSQIINYITYYPSIPVLETKALCNQPPGGTWSDEVKKCQEELNLQKKAKKTTENPWR